MSLRERAADPVQGYTLPRFPQSPVLATVWRGDYIESIHRGSWCLADSAGRVRDGAGEYEVPFFSRSAIKAIQALPLLESGAADRFAFGDPEIALAVSSHDAEEVHVEVARRMLSRIELDETSLLCGPHAPTSREARTRLEIAGEEPVARIHNNCSGKHAGFLALSRHLGAEHADYLAFDGAVQSAVRGALAEMVDLDESALAHGIDGCSAPTYRLPLRALAMSFARLTNPDGLSEPRRRAARRITRAVALHPTLVAGSRDRLCTALLKASEGALFPKLGAEAVYAVGVPGKDIALAVKMDDGSRRGLWAVVVEVLFRKGLLPRAAYDRLGRYRQAVLRNWDRLDVGRIDIEL